MDNVVTSSKMGKKSAEGDVNGREKLFDAGPQSQAQIRALRDLRSRQASSLGGSGSGREGMTVTACVHSLVGLAFPFLPFSSLPFFPR